MFVFVRRVYFQKFKLTTPLKPDLPLISDNLTFGAGDITELFLLTMFGVLKFSSKIPISSLCFMKMSVLTELFLKFSWSYQYLKLFLKFQKPTGDFILFGANCFSSLFPVVGQLVIHFPKVMSIKNLQNIEFHFYYIFFFLSRFSVNRTHGSHNIINFS